jgi:hypothetical protein
MVESQKLEVVLEKTEDEEYTLYEQKNKIIVRTHKVRLYNGERFDSNKCLENHYLIELSLYSSLRYNDREFHPDKLVGIAHNKEELSDKMYKIAKKEAEDLTKKVEGKFIDLTENNKEQESEQKEICNSFGLPLTGPRAEKLRRLSGKY